MADVSWTPIVQTAISGAAVLIASIALLNTMRQSQAQRDDLELTRREAQSRSIDLWVHTDESFQNANAPDSFFRIITIHISNSSAYPIRNVIFELRTKDQVRRNESRVERFVSNVIPPTPIGEYFEWHYDMSIDSSIWAEQLYGTPEPFEISVTFKDSNALKWRRYDDGRIEEVVTSS
jgi:hypothetical protein